MRVGTGFLYQSIQQRIGQLSSDLVNLNEKVASGKTLNRPSDDPIAMVSAMEMKTQMAQFDQYARNLQEAASWLNLSESVVSQALDVVGRARELAVEMASDNQNATTRAAAAQEVGHLLDQAIFLGNTQLAGKFIFAGYKTSSTPFIKITTENGVETAQYYGDTNDFQLVTGNGETITAGKNGQTVFMNTNLFDVLGNLKKGMEDNDLTAIQTQLGNLTSLEDSLNSQIADIGGRSNRVEARRGIIDDLKADLNDRLSQTQDSDLAELTIQLKVKENTYQAALAAAARIDQLSLLDYMQ